MKKLALLVLVSVFFFAAPPGIAAQQDIHLTILHLNDTHGFIRPQIDKSVDAKTPVGGIEYLARMIEEERSRNPEGTILLSAGDMFQGTPISNVFRGRPVLEIMNRLCFDAMTLGNHEFDWGRRALIGLAAAAKFPFLAANVAGKKGKFSSRIKPYVVLERKGLKIAVIGITTPDVPFITKPGNVKGLSFAKPEKILPGLIEKLRAKADLIIVLSHIGFEEDKALAQAVPGIDVIVGGHSHTAVFRPAEVNGAIIVQAKCYARYLGVLKLRIDAESRKIVSYDGTDNLRITFSGPDRPVDERIARFVKSYEDRIKTRFEQVVGETRTDLVRNPQSESNLGNLICDAMRAAAGSQIAFQNSGGIRADVCRGKITLGRLFTVLPFDNEIVSMDLTGRRIRTALEQSVAGEHSILQVSGIEVRYDLSRPPGSRVVAAWVGGRELDPQKTYRVTINDFIAAGGDRFRVFLDGENIERGGELRGAVADYLRSHSPVDPKVEGRIRFQ